MDQKETSKNTIALGAGLGASLGLNGTPSALESVLLWE
jgi:hypothetical protein